MSHELLDLSIGEPHLIRDLFYSSYGDLFKNIKLSDKNWDYHNSLNYKPLLNFLQNKHKSNVVITNGAKQALNACFYLLNKINKKNIFLRTPCWSLIPPLLNHHNLNLTASKDYNSYLLMNPNNPDGHFLNKQQCLNLEQELKDKNIPLIHDAVYNNYCYIPKTEELVNTGDMQVFSLSKMFGFSSLRVGYVVVKDLEYFKILNNYMELSTSGVSHVSQDIALKLLIYNNNSASRFSDNCFYGLRYNRKMLSTVLNDILEIPDNFIDQYGMFAWLKPGKHFDAGRLNVKICDGEQFGEPGKIRINLAQSHDVIKEFVERLKRG